MVCCTWGAAYDAGRIKVTRRGMAAILRTCWQIFLLKSGPQVFPRSWLLFAFMLVSYMLTDTFIGYFEGIHGLELLFETLVDTAMLLTFCVLLLSVLKLRNRINQTLIAFLGTGVLLMLVNLPFMWLSDQNKFPQLRLTANLILIGLLVWSIAVMAHILRHAMTGPNYLALLLAAFYQISNLLLLYWLFPVG